MSDPNPPPGTTLESLLQTTRAREGFAWRARWINSTWPVSSIIPVNTPQGCGEKAAGGKWIEPDRDCVRQDQSQRVGPA